MTSETRGQNSWLNFGPHAEHNRTASGADTIYADQKTGLMPEWTWLEGVPVVADKGRAEGGRIGEGLTDPSSLERRALPAYDPYWMPPKKPDYVAGPYAPFRPRDPLSPVHELISPTMGAYGLGQLLADTYYDAKDLDLLGVGENAAMLAAGMIGVPGVRAGAPKNRNLNALGTYSAAVEGAQNLQIKSGTPEQMLNALKKQPNVKPEELYWMGLVDMVDGKLVPSQRLLDFVEASGGKGKLTKDDLVMLAKERQIIPGKTVLEGDPVDPETVRDQMWDDAVRQAQDNIEIRPDQDFIADRKSELSVEADPDVPGTFLIRDLAREEDGPAAILDRGYKTEREADRSAEGFAESDAEELGMYAIYEGVNRIKDLGGLDDRARERALERYQARAAEDYMESLDPADYGDGGPKHLRYLEDRPGGEDAGKNYREPVYHFPQEVMDRRGAGAFNRSHYNEYPNVFGHWLLHDYTDAATGKKGTFANEGQSDWRKALSKYGTQKSPEEIKGLHDILEAEQRKFHDLTSQGAEIENSLVNEYYKTPTPEAWNAANQYRAALGRVERDRADLERVRERFMADNESIHMAAPWYNALAKSREAAEAAKRHMWELGAREFDRGEYDLWSRARDDARLRVTEAKNAYEQATGGVPAGPIVADIKGRPDQSAANRWLAKQLLIEGANDPASHWVGWSTPEIIEGRWPSANLRNTYEKAIPDIMLKLAREHDPNAKITDWHIGDYEGPPQTVSYPKDAVWQPSDALTYRWFRATERPHDLELTTVGQYDTRPSEMSPGDPYYRLVGEGGAPLAVTPQTGRSQYPNMFRSRGAAEEALIGLQEAWDSKVASRPTLEELYSTNDLTKVPGIEMTPAMRESIKTKGFPTFVLPFAVPPIAAGALLDRNYSDDDLKFADGGAVDEMAYPDIFKTGLYPDPPSGRYSDLDRVSPNLIIAPPHDPDSIWTKVFGWPEEGEPMPTETDDSFLPGPRNYADGGKIQEDDKASAPTFEFNRDVGGALALLDRFPLMNIPSTAASLVNSAIPGMPFGDILESRERAIKDFQEAHPSITKAWGEMSEYPGMGAVFIGPAGAKRLADARIRHADDWGGTSRLKAAEEQWKAGDKANMSEAEIWREHGWTPPDTWGRAPNSNPATVIATPDFELHEPFLRNVAQNPEHKIESQGALKHIVRGIDDVLVATPGLADIPTHLTYDRAINAPTGATSLRMLYQQPKTVHSRPIGIKPDQFTASAGNVDDVRDVMLHELTHGAQMFHNVPNSTAGALELGTKSIAGTAAEKFFEAEAQALQKLYERALMEGRSPEEIEAFKRLAREMYEKRRRTPSYADYLNSPWERGARARKIMGYGDEAELRDLAPSLIDTYGPNALDAAFEARNASPLKWYEPPKADGGAVGEGEDQEVSVMDTQLARTPLPKYPWGANAYQGGPMMLEERGRALMGLPYGTENLSFLDFNVPASWLRAFGHESQNTGNTTLGNFGRAALDMVPTVGPAIDAYGAYQEGDRERAAWSGAQGIFEAATFPAMATRWLPRGVTLSRNLSRHPMKFDYRILKDGRQIGDAQGHVAGNQAYIGWIGDEKIRRGANSIGVGGVRALREGIRRDFPDVKEFAGHRISGSRKGRAADHNRPNRSIQVVRLPAAAGAVYGAMQERSPEDEWGAVLDAYYPAD